MLVKRGASPNVTEVRVGLLMKANVSIVLTELGIATLINLLPSKPLNDSTELGMTTDVSRLFANALSPIDLTELPRVRLVSLLLLKAFDAIVTTKSGTTRLANEFILNAPLPIVISELGKAMLVRAQDWKVAQPTEVTRGASPNVTEARVGLLMKAWSPMLSTEFGMATDVILQLLKAYAAILVEALLISMSPEQQAPPRLFLSTHPVVRYIVGEAVVGSLVGGDVIVGEEVTC